MKKRIRNVLLSILGVFLVLVLALGIIIWYRFRSPAAMKRQGWDYCDSIGSRMTVDPDKESYIDSIIFSVHDYSMIRLETDSVINKGNIVVSIYILENYHPSKSITDVVNGNEKKLINEYKIEESGCEVYDFSDYGIGNYLIVLGWGDKDTDAYCDYTLKDNLYIWQSRYNSLISEYPVLKKIRCGYGSFEGDYIDM